MGIINAKQAILLIMVICLPLITGCLATLHSLDVDRASYNKRLTLGLVQKEIKKGMSSAEVAEVLGAPNIVSTDSQGDEVWIYDRITTSTVYSKGGGGIMAAFIPNAVDFSAFGSSIGGDGGAQTTNQKVLTIIIKFDAQGRVRDINYHASSF